MFFVCLSVFFFFHCLFQCQTGFLKFFKIAEMFYHKALMIFKTFTKKVLEWCKKFSKKLNLSVLSGLFVLLLFFQRKYQKISNQKIYLLSAVWWWIAFYVTCPKEEYYKCLFLKSSICLLCQAVFVHTITKKKVLTNHSCHFYWSRNYTTKYRDKIIINPYCTPFDLSVA